MVRRLNPFGGRCLAAAIVHGCGRSCNGNPMVAGRHVAAPAATVQSTDDARKERA
jgi:hypothetical protein